MPLIFDFSATDAVVEALITRSLRFALDNDKSLDDTEKKILATVAGPIPQAAIAKEIYLRLRDKIPAIKELRVHFGMENLSLAQAKVYIEDAMAEITYEES